MVNRINLKPRFILSVRPILSPYLAITIFYSVCIARYTASVQVFNLGGFFSISMFLLSRNVLSSFDMNALPLSVYFFRGRLKS